MATTVQPELIAEVRRLLDDYVIALDNRRFAQWIDLFSADGYYGVIRHEDFVKGNNMVAVGENLPKLRARLEAGAQVDPDRKLHFLTGLEVSDGAGINATSNFFVLRNGLPSFAGRYHLSLVRAPDGRLKMNRCMAVLDADQITETIYLPI
jgi:3-phenylpropionate/cinnamic acid dioxygenase small subunit